jgi:NAD(P)H-hydrate repair Nnr-like enzyme with NAD(P)H-hydrate epimerase domain
VIPVVTPEEMAEVDRAAPEPVEVLVERAGFAVAHRARRMLGGSYGRRIVVVAGRGNNGADGRVAAGWLARWGSRVCILEAAQLAGGEALPPADLVLDAAYGTGLSREYDPPDPGETPVLAVDIPSGLSGLTGVGQAMTAEGTVTFGAYKPGLLLGQGPDKGGTVEVAGIGLQDLAAARATTWLVDDQDLKRLPRRAHNAHKWQTAVLVVGGSEAMNGAPLMVAHGAMRAGAGYALVAIPGSPPGGGLPPGEHVGASVPREDWAEKACELAKRVKAIAVGPGLGDSGRKPGGGTGPDTPVGRLLAATDIPAVVDADGINALGRLDSVRAITSRRSAPIVLTPHDG